MASEGVRNEVTGSPSAPFVLAGVIHGNVTVHGTEPPVPRQLPPAPRWFTARETELAALTEAFERTDGPLVAVIVGVGGIGKTWLALHWAHRRLESFPDGQVFVDLRGVAPDGQFLPPAAVLRCVLDALGVPPQAVPVDFDAQVGRYRSLVAGKRMLIVFDNVRDAEHVRAALPSAAGCAVLVTSRNQLRGLEASVRIALPPLTEAESVELFERRLGRLRLDAEPEAVRCLVDDCAGLPLALGLAAGRVADHAAFPIAVFARELRETRLPALDGLETVLSWSYQALEPAQAKVFALLGLIPGADAGVRAIECLTELPDARPILRALERVSLVQEHAPGRWQLHDLVRLYALGQLDDAEAALDRFVGYYVVNGCAADRLLDPCRTPIDVGPATERFADRAAALVWFEAEHTCLVAMQRFVAERGRHVDAWRLAWVMHSFHWQQGLVRDQAGTWRVALSDRLDDASSALAHRLLGSALVRTGAVADALALLGQALLLHQGDRWGEGHTHRSLARAWERSGDTARALEHATLAMTAYQAVDAPLDVADALELQGRYEAELGRLDRAFGHHAAALELYRRNGNVDGEATAFDGLGHIEQRAGRLDLAVSHYERAQALFDGRHAYHLADTLDRLAECRAQLGHTAQARQTWETALGLYENQQRGADAERVRGRLDEA
ncbi:ATP-binding protein [Kutzneria sp. CA-103260]|uniref:ATP-binding protein n=1 Tax=Kutzneria sp. CA-103260 TaxID=2802641 RepID=UPI001BA6ED81|nr:tetratricopeptide repeat protein [Kutzneria sp. CA-103260]QUQ67239.1 SARP family transcriptional regulator [Kutzneria sp. CA-103260]